MKRRTFIDVVVRLGALSIAFAVASHCVAAPPRWMAIGPQGAATLVAAVDPAVPDRVYAATLDEVSVSLDGGVIFSKLASLSIEKPQQRPSPYITGMAVLRGRGASTVPVPGDAGLVVQFYTTTEIPSLYVSRDGGRSWTPGLEAETGNPIKGNWKTLAAVPGSATVAYAFGGLYSGNFRTDDGGSTWRTTAGPPGNRHVVPITEDLVVTVGALGLFRTTDGGKSWIGVSTGLPAPPYDYVGLAADSKESTTLWLVIGGMGTFRSQDAGATWTQQGAHSWQGTWSPTDLFVDGETLFAVNNGVSTSRSRDGGRTWTNLNPAPNAAIGPVLARDAITDRLYFGAGSGTTTNLRYSIDDGNTLLPSERGIHGIDVRYLFTDKVGRLYSWVGYPDNRLRRRDPLGDEWTDITPAMYAACGGYYGPGPIVVADDDTPYAAEPGGIVRSVDGGDHWTSVPSIPPVPVNWYCLLAVTPDDYRVIYSRIDTYGKGQILIGTTVLRSNDGGTTWSPISQPFTITYRLHAASRERLIALGGPTLAGRQVATSLDGGNSWSVSLSAVRDLGVSASRPEVVLVADDSGVYRSDDGGATLTYLGSLPDTSITQVALDPLHDQVAYAVTDRGNPYRSTDGGVTWVAVGGSFDSLVDLYDVVATAAAPSTLIAGTNHGVYTFYVGNDQRELAEFYHPSFDHYFLSADPAEMSFLRLGGMPPWRPTGRWFWGWDIGAFGAVPVCRFWSGQTFAPKSSHFYTPYAAECAYLKQQGVWQYEGDVFALGLPAGPPGQGTCGTATQPLYRAYNNGMSGAPNHRYTTDPAVLDAMIAQGWIMEGEASTRVFACVPAQ